MTAVADAKSLIELLIGRASTVDEQNRISDAFVNSDPYMLGNFADPENPTNEEKAQLFMDTILRFGKEIVKNEAEASAHAEAQATIVAAGSSAIADWE